MADHLKKHGYHESAFTKGLFTHESRDISFILVVDDFGVKYTRQADLDHLLHALEEKYEMKLDLEAKQYDGIDLQWDYTNRTVTYSMDEHIETALQELEHVPPKQHTLDHPKQFLYHFRRYIIMAPCLP